jgi:hypothetical protein
MTMSRTVSMASSRFSVGLVHTCVPSIRLSKAQRHASSEAGVHAGGGQSHRLVAATANCQLQRRLVGLVSDRPIQHFTRSCASLQSHVCSLVRRRVARERLVFAWPERRLHTEVTRRFCESASRTATAGPPPAVTTRTASSPALESGCSTIVARTVPYGHSRGARRFVWFAVTERGACSTAHTLGRPWAA